MRRRRVSAVSSIGLISTGFLPIRKPNLRRKAIPSFGKSRCLSAGCKPRASRMKESKTWAPEQGIERNPPMEFRYDPSARRFRIRTLVPAGQPERTFTVDDQFQFGIEEEYFLCDAQTLRVPAETPDALFKRANFGVSGSIGREFLQAQIEVATEPHINAADARREVLRLRQNAAAAAAEHGLSIAACGTHPMAHWREAVRSPKDRYANVMDVLQMIGQRNM